MGKNRYRILSKLIALTALCPGVGLAGEVEVVEVRASAVDGGYRFDVTLRHADTGWDHYADQWQVFAPDGRVLGTRTLHHPHVDEQPFTRSLSVTVPAGLERVSVRARDSVHGYGADYPLELKP